MRRYLSFYFALLRTSLRASISKRAAFLTETLLMIANNLVFFAMWWIFFRQFQSIEGWTLDDMIALTAVGVGAYGLSLVFFGGTKSMAQMITSGDIDPFMTQPKSLLLHIIASKSRPKGWGHLATAGIMIGIGGLTSPATLALVFLGQLTGCIVFVSIAIIAHSLPFWLGAVEGLSKKYCDALFLFALYPTNIYSGMLQLLMFTVIPAGVISFIPVELIRSFSWHYLAWLLVSTAAISTVAIFTFYHGLRRYESGNQFGLRR